jgi:threonine dehydrogenase-like Zn-dependent dehydrogenase
VHLLDRTATGPKPELADALGARYHTDGIETVMERVQPDVVIEATGAAPVALGAMAGVPSYGVVCLTGLGGTGRTLELDAGELNRELVMDNAAVVGSVNANLDHYAAAADALAAADRDWLERLITRRVPLARFTEAFARKDGDVKTVLDLTQE